MPRRLLSLVMISAGFILSPLSWWNDMVVNVPLAYMLSWPVARLSPGLFPAAFILGYWFTNLLGFLLLHWGGVGISYHGRDTISIRRALLVSVAYSMVMVILVLAGWLPSPAELLRTQ